MSSSPLYHLAALALVTLVLLQSPVGSRATPSGVIEFEVGGVRWQQLYDHNTGRYYFSDTSNSHTQWEDPRKAGAAGPDGGLVATLALAPIVFLGVAMFIRVMYLQVYYPEYLYPKRYRKARKKGFPRNKVSTLRNRNSLISRHPHPVFGWSCHQS